MLEPRTGVFGHGSGSRNQGSVTRLQDGRREKLDGHVFSWSRVLPPEWYITSSESPV